MGFCRRCGDIVVGPRCRCGGTAVDPVVRWNPGNNSKSEVSDRWSQTYVSRGQSPERRSPSGGLSAIELQTSRSVSPTKRFPHQNTSKPNSTAQPLIPQVTAHIASTTSYRPKSPLKYSSTTSGVPASPTTRAATGILPSPYTSELSKAYGSVLQPKESLLTHKCALCSAVFLPDATIYPDPNASAISNRFLCRLCFTENGGSKGECPVCHRPVLILKSEGGFVENSGRVWHKRCFRCDTCFKDIGDTPMVDLLGRPSCAECFDTCLKKSPGRDSIKNSPRGTLDNPDAIKEKRSNLGGVRCDRKSREGSPAIEELEQRLGMIKSRDSSPALEELTQRLNAVSSRTPTKGSPTRSPDPRRGDYVSSQDGSPFVERKGKGASLVGIGGSPFTSSLSGSPARSLNYEGHTSPMNDSPSQRTFDHFSIPGRELFTQCTGSPVSKDEAVEEMKMRFLRHAVSAPKSPRSGSSSPFRQPSPAVKSPTPQKAASRIPVSTSRHETPALRHSYSSSSLSSSRGGSFADIESSVPSTPELTSDFSDNITNSSAPSSPPAYADDVFNSNQRPFVSLDSTDDDDEHQDGFNSHTTPTPKPKPRPLPSASSPSSSTLCAKCGGALFTKRDGGKYVTVPEEAGAGDSAPKTYHRECFKCNVCQEAFRETGTGQAVFVRGAKGACHPECAPPEKISIRTLTTSAPFKFSSVPLSTPASTTSFPRFGSATACPGCHKSVSIMEKGVVPGPQGTKWHVNCLVCGGKGAADKKGRRHDEKQPGCGKRLDSSAKGDGEGGIWCRECSLSLSMKELSHASPTRTAMLLAPSFTGRSTPFGAGTAGARITPQYTGATTIARQSTGLGGLDAVLIRQSTGGSLSPTRQLAGSPTKQLGMIGATRPRPKSVIGMSAKSVDKGRGMYLVRQMTGAGD